VNQRAGLRRLVISCAKKMGIYSALRAIYIRLSSQHTPLSDNGEGQVSTCNGTTATLSPPGTLTVDELLSRVHAELHETPIQGQQQ
jgi:hypothetical protein